MNGIIDAFLTHPLRLVDSGTGVHVKDTYGNPSFARTFNDPGGEIAQMILALPDLLAAAETVLKTYDELIRMDEIGDEHGFPELRAAVAKAKGET